MDHGRVFLMIRWKTIFPLPCLGAPLQIWRNLTLLPIPMDNIWNLSVTHIIQPILMLKVMLQDAHCSTWPFMDRNTCIGHNWKSIQFCYMKINNWDLSLQEHFNSVRNSFISLLTLTDWVHHANEHRDLQWINTIAGVGDKDAAGVGDKDAKEGGDASRISMV